MTKPAAERELGELHSLQTKVYVRALRTILDALDGDDEEARMIALSALNPSLMNAVNAFLKNNSITCTPEALEDLTNAEKEIRARGKMKLPPMPSLEDFDEAMQ
jgi:HJR/Mrr/RecB family endonuclease